MKILKRYYCFWENCFELVPLEEMVSFDETINMKDKLLVLRGNLRVNKVKKRVSSNLIVLLGVLHFPEK